MVKFRCLLFIICFLYQSCFSIKEKIYQVNTNGVCTALVLKKDNTFVFAHDLLSYPRMSYSTSGTYVDWGDSIALHSYSLGMDYWNKLLKDSIRYEWYGHDLHTFFEAKPAYLTPKKCTMDSFSMIRVSRKKYCYDFLEEFNSGGN